MHVWWPLLLVTLAACVPCPGDFLSGLGCSQPAGSVCESSVGITWTSGTCATARMDGEFTVWGAINFAGGILIVGPAASVTGDVVQFNPSSLHVEEDARIHSQGIVNFTADAASIGRGASVTGTDPGINADTLRIETGATLTSQGTVVVSAGNVWIGEGAVVTGTSVVLVADSLEVAWGAAIRCEQQQCKVDVLARLVHINGTVRAGDVRISATENVTLRGHVNANGLGAVTRRRRNHGMSMIPHTDSRFPTSFGFRDHGPPGAGRVLLEACQSMHLDGNITASAVAGGGTGGSILARGQTVTGSTRIEASGSGNNGYYGGYQPYSGGIVAVRGNIVAYLVIIVDPNGVGNHGGIQDPGPQYLHYPGTDLMCPTNLTPAPAPSPPSPCFAQVVPVAAALEVMSPPLLDGGTATWPCPHGHVGYVTLQCSRGVVAAVPSNTSCKAGCSVTRRLSASSELPEQYLETLDCSSLEHGNHVSVPCLSGSGEASLWCENGELQTDAVAGCFGTSTESTTSSTSKTSSTSTRTTSTVSTTTRTTETVTTVTATTLTTATMTVTATTMTSTTTSSTGTTTKTFTETSMTSSTLTTATMTITKTTVTSTTTSSTGTKTKTFTETSMTSSSSTTSATETTATTLTDTSIAPTTVTMTTTTTMSSSGSDGGGKLPPRPCAESEFNKFFSGAAVGAAVFVLASLAWRFWLKRLCRLQLQCLREGFCPQSGPTPGTILPAADPSSPHPVDVPPPHPVDVPPPHPVGVPPPPPVNVQEFNFTGKSGQADLAVVSCPGGADEAIGMGVGEIFTMLRMILPLAVSVIFVRGTYDPWFWDKWRNAVRCFAEGKKYVIVITKQTGEIGNYQKQEVRYLANACTGEIEPNGAQSPNLKDAIKLAMTYKEFIAWMRMDWAEDALGHPLYEGFQNEHVQSLPSLSFLQEEFQRLVDSPNSARDI